MIQLVIPLHLDAGGQVGIAGREGVDILFEGLQAAAELSDGQQHQHEQQSDQGQLDCGQCGEHVLAVLGQGAGWQGGGQQPGGPLYGLQQQCLFLPLILESGAQQPCTRLWPIRLAMAPAKG